MPINNMLGRFVVLLVILGWTSGGCRNSADPRQPSGDVQTLIQQLRSPNRDEAVAAAVALVDHPESVDDFIKPLCLLLTSSNREIRKAGQKALEALGLTASDALEPLLFSADDIEFQMGCDAIAAIGLPAARWREFLVENLRHESLFRQVMAAYGMRGLGPLVADQVDELARLLDERESLYELFGERDFNIHIFICQTLMSIGPKAHAAGPALLRLVADGNTSSRSYALWTLGTVYPIEGEDVVGLLTRHLDAFLQPEQERALRGLIAIGPDARAALPRIGEKLEDEHSDLQPRAALALYKIGGDIDGAIANLMRLSRDPNFEVAVFECFAELGPDGAAAMDYLLSRLGDADESIRELAINAIAGMGRAATPHRSKIDALTADPDPMVRLTARLALMKIPAP